jgi:cobalt-zinc-cadmium efflux system protein
MTTSHDHTSHDEHDHDHDHDHGHDHAGHSHGSVRASSSGQRDLLIALGITFGMMVAEVVGGLLSNSLALLSDAGHMLADNIALLLSFFALKFATRPATERKTFGFYRLEILAALLNGVVLVLLSIYIIYEAYQRILHPEPVHGMMMLIVAAIGLVANIVGAGLLMKHSHANLNIRGAYLHIVGDALSSIGVVIGGILILTKGWDIVDPVLSIMISFVIIYGSWALVKESVDILLESVPKHVQVGAVEESINTVPGVREAYHIHVWTLTSGVYALSAHVLIDDQLVSGCRNIVDDIRAMLAAKFNILHSTIQIECDRCSAGGLACSLPVPHADKGEGE